MLIDTGTDDLLIMRSKTKTGFLRETRFWAERGIIHCEDNIDGYSSMSVRTFLRRAKALCDMLLNRAANSDCGADAALRSDVQSQLDKAERIARKAQIQGMPDDPSARRDILRRRKTTVSTTRRGIM